MLDPTEQTDRHRPRLTAGQVAVTVGALVCTAVGLNTAWGFTHDHLHIADLATRVALCGTGEIVLIALGLAARDNSRSRGSPGTAGTLVWVITGFLAVPAFGEAASQAHGFAAALTAGIWRAVFGPLAAALLWHYAMGLELRRVGGRRTSIPARILRHWGQALLARLAVPGDRDATAAELARDRARVRAAELTDRYSALPPRAKGGRRGRRVRRRLRAALRGAGVAHDPQAKAALLADLAVSAHAAALAGLDYTSPWALLAPGADPGNPPVPALSSGGVPERPEPAEPRSAGLPPGSVSTGDVRPARATRPVPGRRGSAVERPSATASGTGEVPRPAGTDTVGGGLAAGLVRDGGGTPTDHIKALVGDGITETEDIKRILEEHGIRVPSDRYIRKVRNGATLTYPHIG